MSPTPFCEAVIEAIAAIGESRPFEPRGGIPEYLQITGQHRVLLQSVRFTGLKWKRHHSSHFTLRKESRIETKYSCFACCFAGFRVGCHLGMRKEKDPATCRSDRPTRYGTCAYRQYLGTARRIFGR
jgi:hypothetical protein